MQGMIERLISDTHATLFITRLQEISAHLPDGDGVAAHPLDGAMYCGDVRANA